eukprot:scaffold41086_cov17-Tisochrysis_lutea.AAC.1
MGPGFYTTIKQADTFGLQKQSPRGGPSWPLPAPSTSAQHPQRNSRHSRPFGIHPCSSSLAATSKHPEKQGSVNICMIRLLPHHTKQHIASCKSTSEQRSQSPKLFPYVRQWIDA